MSFEFTHRITELTNKLTQINKGKLKEDKLEEAKEQLISLQGMCYRELENAGNKMKRIEGRLKKRSCRAYSQSSSIEQIWVGKQERVSEVIGGWVSDYQQKMQQALSDLNRQQVIFRTKLQEQEQICHKETKLVQERIKNQMKILEKQISKLKSIDSQNHDSILSQLSFQRLQLAKQLAQSEDIKDRQIRSLYSRINQIQEQFGDKKRQLEDTISKYGVKSNQIFQLLLDLH